MSDSTNPDFRQCRKCVAPTACSSAQTCFSRRRSLSFPNYDPDCDFEDWEIGSEAEDTLKKNYKSFRGYLLAAKRVVQNQLRLAFRGFKRGQWRSSCAPSKENPDRVVPGELYWLPDNCDIPLITIRFQPSDLTKALLPEFGSEPEYDIASLIAWQSEIRSLSILVEAKLEMQKLIDRSHASDLEDWKRSFGPPPLGDNGVATPPAAPPASPVVKGADDGQ